MSDPPPRTSTDWTSPSASYTVLLLLRAGVGARLPAVPRVPATPNLGGVSTRMLIILALVCGLAVLVAFAVQAAQII